MLTVTGSWGQTATAHVTVPAGNSNSIVTVNAAAADVRLWWPAGHGAQPLYNVTLSFTPSAADTGPHTATAAAGAAAISATRRIGFRMFAVVHGARFLWQKFTLEEAIGSHALLRLNLLLVCDQRHSSRASTTSYRYHRTLHPNTEGLVTTRTQNGSRTTQTATARPRSACTGESTGPRSCRKVPT
jgi:hypothetical protein